jgi:hypothetical protein
MPNFGMPNFDSVNLCTTVVHKLTESKYGIPKFGLRAELNKSISKTTNNNAMHITRINISRVRERARPETRATSCAKNGRQVLQAAYGSDH